MRQQAYTMQRFTGFMHIQGGGDISILLLYLSLSKRYSHSGSWTTILAVFSLNERMVT